MTFAEDFYDIGALVRDKSFVLNFIGTILGAALTFAAAIFISSASKIPIRPLAVVIEAPGKSETRASIENIGQISNNARLVYYGWQTSLHTVCSLDEKDINTISSAFQQGSAKLVVKEDDETTIANATKIDAEVCNRVRLAPAKYKSVEAIFAIKELALGDNQAERAYRVTALTESRRAPLSESNWRLIRGYLERLFLGREGTAIAAPENGRGDRWVDPRKWLQK
jgi:hypothetical protein